MVAQTARTVTTRLICGFIVTSRPGVYATRPSGYAALRPAHLTETRRKG